MDATWKAFARYKAKWQCKLDSFFFEMDLLFQGDAGWFKKVPLWRAVGLLALTWLSLNVLFVCLFFLLSCLLLWRNHLHLDFASLFHMGKINGVHLSAILTNGISFSSALGAVRWMEWAEGPHVSPSLGEGRNLDSVKSMFTENLLSSRFPYFSEMVRSLVLYYPYFLFSLILSVNSCK